MIKLYVETSSFGVTRTRLMKWPREVLLSRMQKQW